MEATDLSNEGSRLQSLQETTKTGNEEITKKAIQTKKEKSKKRHNSALVAAAAGRSAVQHAHLHILTNKPGDFAHSETNISYDN